MRASVIENGERSPEFVVSNGTKQGCGLAPLLFCIFFSMMLLIAFQNTSKGIPLHYRTDGDLFNTRRFQAPTKVHTAIIRDLLFADDCALDPEQLDPGENPTKTENLGFSRSSISVAMGRGRAIFWAIVYFMDLSFCAKFQGCSSTASYLSQGSLMKMPSVKYASEAILGHVYLYA